MSANLTTYSSFYYGYTITADNQYLDFKEGSTTYLATLTNGKYTLTDLLVEIKRAFEETGSFTYTVTVDRPSRRITIAATGTISLLTSTGANVGLSAYSLLGFTGSDRTGASTYTGNNGSGYAYYPQFFLQDYISSDDFQNAIDATVNKTSTGDVEAIIFGTEKFVQFSIRLATDIDQGGGPVLTNENGVDNLRSFMQAITTKAPIEFNFDSSDTSDYQVLILDSLPESNTGTGYKLKELYDRNLPGYFETSVMKFRLIE